MRVIPNLIYRVFIAAICLLGTGQYIQWARADWLASEATRDGLTKALRIEPENSDLVRRIVSYRNGWADVEWVNDDELRRAVQMNPLDAELWIPLALREEANGHEDAAEADLVRAAEVNHEFIPTWVLANYYFRVDKADKAWPLLEQCLRLDLENYSLAPVFDLAWNNSSDATRIQSLLPKHGPMPAAYLNYLIATDRRDAAIAAWPLARAAGTQEAVTRDILRSFPDYLLKKGRNSEAVSVWNALIDDGLIASRRLRPAVGDSVADPEFRFTEHPGAFGWQITRVAGVYASALSAGGKTELSLDLDGNEPEAVDLISTIAAVGKKRSLRLRVARDPSRLKNSEDPGFTIRAEQTPGKVLAECPILPLKGDSAICPLTVPEGVDLVRIVLAYRRSPGTVRAEGTLRLRRAALEFAD